ncbi:MAG: hypothetical protein IPM54_35995 [Polyangiaceae bacterium]|nr:hypothetical protein [Polyangiaceae bacterium]
MDALMAAPDNSSEKIARPIRRRRPRAARSAGAANVTIGGLPVAFDDVPGDDFGTGASDVFVGTTKRHIARRGVQMLVTASGNANKPARTATARGASSRPKVTLTLRVKKAGSWPVTRCGAGFLHGFVKKPKHIRAQVNKLKEQSKNKKIQKGTEGPRIRRGNAGLQ